MLSRGWIEVEEQMGWNGHSWLLSSILPAETILSLASLLYVVVTAGFVAGGVGYVLDQDWTVAVLVGSAILSTVVLVVMWDGKTDLLIEMGWWTLGVTWPSSPTCSLDDRVVSLGGFLSDVGCRRFTIPGPSHRLWQTMAFKYIKNITKYIS